MILVNRESSSHWYLPDGTAFHEVSRATGNGLRPVTLRDARKTAALPSVTNILGVLAKPGLESWKQEQAILAALTLPRKDGKPLDVFAHRVVEDMGEQVRHAADLGSAVHRAIETYLQTGERPDNPDVLPLFEPVKLWLDDHLDRIGMVEAVAVSQAEGFAGRVDLVARIKPAGTWAVIDFKTQRMRRDTKGILQANFYDTWPLQLTAYREALQAANEHGRRLEDIASVVISSTEPAPVQVRVWPRERHRAYWRAFLSARDLWCFSKDYFPHQDAVPHAV